MNNYSNKKIALIDDDNLNLKIALKKLEPYKMKVDEGKSAAELFELLKMNEYDLIILDDMMPIMYGTAAMQQLRKQGYTKPIVVLTGNTEHNPPRPYYIGAGFDEFLAKPINNDELNRILNIFLKEAN